MSETLSDQDRSGAVLERTHVSALWVPGPSASTWCVMTLAPTPQHLRRLLGGAITALQRAHHTVLVNAVGLGRPATLTYMEAANRVTVLGPAIVLGSAAVGERYSSLTLASLAEFQGTFTPVAGDRVPANLQAALQQTLP